MTSTLNVSFSVTRMSPTATTCVTKYVESGLQSNLTAIAEHLREKGNGGYSAEWLKHPSAGAQSDNTMIGASILALRISFKTVWTAMFRRICWRLSKYYMSNNLMYFASAT